VIGALPYAMLAFVTVLTVVLRQASHDSWLIDLGLCALTAAWMVWMVTLHPEWQTRGRIAGSFFAGLVILMAVLVFRDPWFGFFTFATLTGTSQAGGVPRHGGIIILVWAACVVVNLAVAGAFPWFGWVMNTQNERRKTLVEDLSTANKRLEATLAENAGLHQQLLTQAREAGILDERQRMAREIHDTLAQGLTGIITPAPGGRAGHRRPGRAAAAFRRGDPAGPRQPDRGAPVGGRAAPAAAGIGAAARRADPSPSAGRRCTASPPVSP
jgi:signal transduction histidine kinase